MYPFVYHHISYSYNMGPASIEKAKPKNKYRKTNKIKERIKTKDKNQKQTASQK